MAVNYTSGVPNLSTNGWIPKFYDSQTNFELYANLTIAAISNTNHTSQIKNLGDEVNIQNLPAVNIYDYEKHGTLDTQITDPGNVQLLIDTAKYYNVAIDNVDEFQSHHNIQSEIGAHAAREMAIHTDRTVFADIPGDADANNQGATAGVDSGDINLGVAGTPLQLTSSTSISTILDCATVLDEQNVPDDGRYIVLPPWAIQALKESDMKSVQITGDGTSPLRNGMIGNIDRFKIYSSNLISSAIDGSDKVWNCSFGHVNALTFASQIVKTRLKEPSNTFSAQIQGLNVYGWKVIKPEAFGNLYIKK